MTIKEEFQSLLRSVSTFLTISNASFILWIGFVIGIFTSDTHRVVSTVCMIILFVVSIVSLIKNGWQSFTISLPILLLSGVFFLHLAYAGMTDFLTNGDYYKGRLLLKVPFLLFPFIISALPPLSKKRYHFLLYTFLICSVIIALKATLYYLTHTAEVNELYLRSKTIPLPLNHVRFSLVLSLSVFIGIYLFLEKNYFLNRIEIIINLILTLFLFLFLHLLSVRSGLLAFYILAFTSTMVYAWKTKKYKAVIVTLALMILIPVGSYLALGSFRNKVANTLEDINNTQHEYYANFHSLTARVFSYKVAYKLFKDQPVLGVGIGNVDREVKKAYIRHYPEITPKSRLKPHNQFIFYGVSFGVVGLIIFIIAFYAPILLTSKFRGNALVLGQYLIVTISFLFESTIETQLGLNFALGIIIISIYYELGKKVETE